MTRRTLFDRRQVLAAASALALVTTIPTRSSAAPLKLLFVHGRGQGGLDPDELKSTWLATLKEGADALGRTIPEGIDVAFPYYGDALDEFARDLQLPLASEINARGDTMQEDFVVFQAQMAEEIRQSAGVTDAQVDEEYGANPRPRAPWNWEWVQAIIRAIDRNAPGLSQGSLKSFMRDVFLYTTSITVQEAIDKIVSETLTEQPTIVVGHSLGSVVAYHVLRTDPRRLSVPLYLTVGCPLGIKAISTQFRPLKFPVPVNAWYNAFDDRDVVALNPLDAAYFAVTPAIENFDGVDNQTENRHGIVGYLNDKSVAGKILDAIGTERVNLVVGQHKRLQVRRASFEASLREAPQDEGGG